VTSTIISNPQGGPSCDGSVNTDGLFNIDQGDTCGIATSADVDPQLGALAANGGPTLTHKPAATSPAIDQGTASGATSDQREQPRPFDMPSIPNASDGSDVGALEFQNSDFPAPTPPGPEPEPEPGDTTLPDTQITQGPKVKTSKKSATFAFTSSEAGSTFECKLDDGPFSPCTSPRGVKVGKGKHSFAVRATDAAGNTDPTPATASWKVRKKKRK
jgi:hypothetical protein